MRPRVFPAEDSLESMKRNRLSYGFNEAAGIPRGRQVPSPVLAPPVSRFNEAAGIPRGRPQYAGIRGSAVGGFNEAAGIPRGRLPAKPRRSKSLPALQ